MKEVTETVLKETMHLIEVILKIIKGGLYYETK